MTQRWEHCASPQGLARLTLYRYGCKTLTDRGLAKFETNVTGTPEKLEGNN